MPIYPYSFTMPPVNKQDIPSDGVVGEFLGISAGGVLDWLPVASGGGDMLKSENLSGLANYATARTNIGLGTTSSPEFANLTLTSPSLSSSAPVTISQTWGTLNATYTAFKVNATESATSNSASRLLDLQLGSVSLCNVNRIGSLSIGRSGQTFGSSVGSKIIINGWEPAGIEVDSHIGGGQGLAVLYFSNQAAFTFGANGRTSAGGISIPSGGIVGWAPQSSGSSNSDTILVRDSPSGNTLALRNGAAAQTFNVYGTSSASNANYARLALTCGLDGNATISTQALGTGTAGVLAFSPGNSERMRITTAGNVGIGTTSPTSKLHVAGSSSPTITVENTLATGYSQFLFKNTAVTGDGFWLNGSAQSGYGGPSSFNLFASSGPMAFHTASVTNALSIAQNGLATFNSGLAVTGSVDVTLIRSGYYIQTGTQFIFGSGGIADVGFSRTSAGVAEVNSGTAGTFRDLRVRSVIEQPPASITPALNGDLVVEATSNTTLTFKLKGTDGTVRTGTITLA